MQVKVRYAEPAQLPITRTVPADARAAFVSMAVGASGTGTGATTIVVTADDEQQALALADEWAAAAGISGPGHAVALPTTRYNISRPPD